MPDLKVLGMQCLARKSWPNSDPLKLLYIELPNGIICSFLSVPFLPLSNMCWVVKEEVTTWHKLREGSSTAKEQQAGI